MHQLPDGLGCADIFPDEGLIDHEDKWRMVGIQVGEAAASEQRNAHGGKVMRVSIGEFRSPLNRADMHVVAPAASAKRGVGGRGGILHARDAADFLD